MNCSKFIRKRHSPKLNPAFLLILLAFALSLSHGQPSSNSTSHASYKLLSDIVVEKTSTNFDGTNKDGSIQYIGLNGENGIHASIQPASGLFRDLDYTFMIWLKPEEDVWLRQLSYAFVIPAAFGCYFSGSKTLVCESSQVCDKLNISTQEVVANEWVHLTVSGSPSKKTSYALLETRTEVIGQDTKDYVILNQPNFFWEVCIGICNEKFGFLGGVREFVFIEQYLTQSQTSRIKNHYLTWTPQILAYYRFGTRYLNEEYTNILARVAGKKPEKREDIVSNDICYPFNNFEQFQYFNQDDIMQNMTISEYFEPKKQDYSYTFSLWIYMLPDNCYESIPYIASQSCHLFQLYDSFMLYQERPNYLRFYFFAFRNYYEISSTPFFLPYNQWINIQLSFNQFEGYTVATYDMQGRELERHTKVYNMQEQFPRKRAISLLPKFRGYVRSFFLLGSKRSLPFRLSIDDYMSNTDFIYYLKFQPQYNDNPNQMTNYGDINGVSQAAHYNKKPPVYHYLEFYRSVDDGYTDAGTTTATQALFDGVACNDGSYFLYATDKESYVTGRTADVEQYYDDLITEREKLIQAWEEEHAVDESDGNSTNATNSSSNSTGNDTPSSLDSSSTNSSGSVDPNTLPPITKPSMMSNATVEFWFKPTDFESISYLFTLYSQSFDKEFFSIFKDTDGNVVCAPFGFISFTSPVAIYTNLTQYRMDNWIHMSCSYTYQADVEGSLYFLNSPDENPEQFYTTDISSMTQYMPFERYDVILGNSETLKSGSSSVFYKDVKVWGIRRSREQLASWRFRQVSPFFYKLEELIAYFRLNQANFTETNYLYIAEKEYTTLEAEINEIEYVQDSGLVICPQYTYFDNGHCYDKPLDFLLPQVFYIQEDETGAISYNFTIRNSAILHPSFFSEMNIIWYSTDSLLTHFISQQQNALDLIIPADALAQHRNYWLRTFATNNQSTFIEHNTIQFLPLSCKWVEVEGEGAYGGKMSILDPQSTVDVVLRLKVKQSTNGCDAYYDQLKPQVTYVVTPLMEYFPELIIEQLDAETIEVIIPKEEQSKFEPFIDINLNFQVYWTNSAYADYIESESYLFSSVTYTINFAYSFMEIKPVLTQNFKSVLQFDTVVLDGSESHIYPLDDNQKFDNLTYQWVCPLALQALCDDQTESTLAITFTDFMFNSGRYAYPYTFQLLVTWSTPTGNQETAYTQTSISWYNISSLTFTIAYVPPILSTNANTLRFSFDNYDTAAVADQIDLSLYFSPAVDEDVLEFADATTLVIPADTLKQNTQYSLMVTARSRQHQDANYSQILTFKTKYPPYGGYVEIQPTEGVVNQTDFFVNLKDWQSDFPPIEYQVWQTDSSTGSTPVHQLYQQWVASDLSKSFQVVNTYPIIVIIRDSSSETVMYKLTATISANPSLSGSSKQETVTELVTMISASSENLNQKYDYMNMLANTVNEEDDSDESIDLLLDTMDADLKENENRARKTKIILNEGSYVASRVTQSGSLTDAQLRKTTNILDSFSSTSSYTELLTSGSTGFVNNVAGALSNILSHNNKKNAEALGSGRRLQSLSVGEREEMQEECHEKIVEMANALCSGMGSTYTEQYVDTDAFTLFVKKVDQAYRGDEVKVESMIEEGTWIVFQVKDIMTEAFSVRQLDSSSFCTQVIYYKESPYHTDALEQNYTPSSSYLWIDVVDGQLQSIQKYIGLQLFTSIQFQLDSSTFIGNQTVCMSYAQKAQEWDDEICYTSIDTEDLSAQCYCKSAQNSHYALLTDASRVQDSSMSPFDNSGSTPAPRPTKASLQDWCEISEQNDGYYDQLTLVAEGEESNEQTPDVGEQNPDDIQITQASSGYTYIVFVVFMVLFAVILPIIAMRWDKKDSDRLHSKIDTGSFRMQQLRKVAEVSGESVAYWKFKQDDIQIYSMTSLSTFSVLLIKSHPLLSFFHSYDLLESRMLRFTIYNAQVGLYALLCVGAFGCIQSTASTQSEQDYSKLITIITIIGMVMLLPWTGAISCLRNRHKQKHKSQFNEQQRQQYDVERELDDILVLEKCSILKFAMFAIGYALVITAITLTIIYSQDEEFSQSSFTLTFFLGLLGSWFISSTTLIFIQSLILDHFSSTLSCIIPLKQSRIHSELTLVRHAESLLCDSNKVSARREHDPISQNRLKYEIPQHHLDFDDIANSNKALEGGQDLYQTVQEKRAVDFTSGAAEHSTAHKNLATVEDMQGERQKEGGEPELCDSVIMGEERRAKSRLGVLDKVRSSIEKSQRVRYSGVHEHTLSSEQNSK